MSFRWKSLVTTKSTKPTILISANSSWNLINFRSNLIRSMREKGFRIAAIAPRDTQSDLLADLVDEYHALDFKSAGMSPLADAHLLMRYIALMRLIRPAIFLGFTIKPNIYGSLAAQRCGVPVINNVSGLGTVFIHRGIVTKIVKQLYRQAFKNSGVVFFQNNEDRQHFVDERILFARQALLLPGSGVDLKRFTSTPMREEGPFTFLLVCRLLWDKGVQEFIDAASIVKRRNPSTKFRILGFVDVDNRTSVPNALLVKWEREGLVEYLGAADDVRPFIEASDCVVLPSYREGLPRVLLEASAMARPIVATDVPGIRDVVDDGVTGLLCEVRSATSLASAMMAMLALPLEERRHMAEAGRRRVERKFDIELVTQRYLEAISNLGAAPE